MNEKQNHEPRHEINIKDGQTVALCRCWASKKFPYCDGSHRKLDDNLGPVIVKGSTDE